MIWVKSGYSSGTDGESCVEMATTPGTIHIRDSKYRDESPRLALAPVVWAEFVQGVIMEG
ncbi:DUF397 domain-containing protein [Streptomyces sp. bgisy153]|uniref:DUF397 domain-containing protein n=1 Tax=Streptomyces sp. bgisy153 TaxID=3413793 RepID=UPI003D75F3BE